VLIPASAHGTNPASAVMAGFRVVVVATDSSGNVDVADLKAKSSQHANNLAGLMITYPSTHGVFEDAIREICAIVHEHGGQVYMDGANMNAQVGLTSPASIGADVCHLNLHKTFAIPHGGGGPAWARSASQRISRRFFQDIRSPGGRFGSDSAGVSRALGQRQHSADFVRLHSYARRPGCHRLDPLRHPQCQLHQVDGSRPTSACSTRAPMGRVAHEMIFDLRAFKSEGCRGGRCCQAPDGLWLPRTDRVVPCPGTLMIEPTESESKAELDRFCEALIAIRGEIEEVVTGLADAKDNVLKHAPHTAWW
jgi:glycine dehydrogenase